MSRWLAASYQPSHTVQVFGMRVCVITSSIPTYPVGFKKAGDSHCDIKTRKSEESRPSQGTPSAQIPLYAPVYYGPK